MSATRVLHQLCLRPQIPVKKLPVLGLRNGAACGEFKTGDVFLCEFKNLNFEVRAAYAGLC